MSHPDVRAVLPLMPEPILQQDGTSTNDGARHAATRFVAKWRHDHPHLQCIVTEDRLSSKAPHLETLHDHHLHDLLGVKAGDQTWLFKQVQAADQVGRVTHSTRHDHTTGRVHRGRFVTPVPLHASHVDVRVKFIEDWEMRGDTVQHVSGVTDLRVSQGHVSRLMQGGRARWKIEHETFNTLNNQGDNVEHNDGHGTQHLSVVCAMVMMLACVVDQTQQLCCALFRAVSAKMGSKRHWWERLRSLFYDYRLTSMREWFEALFYGLAKPRPGLLIDAS